MGAGGSIDLGESGSTASYQLSSTDMDLIYEQSLQVIRSTCGFTNGGEGNSQEHAVFVQIVEKKFDLTPGSFAELVATKGKKDEDKDDDDVREDVGDEKPVDAKDQRSLSRPRLSRAELTECMTLAGIAGTDEAHKLDALHEHIDQLMEKKEKEERLNWKAIELLGDEDMAKHQRELPPEQMPSSKALSKLGTVKAVESKKVRDRLGSDMSSDAVKRQQIAELREKKQSERSQHH